MVCFFSMVSGRKDDKKEDSMTPEEKISKSVQASIKSDGTFDRIRKKVREQVKSEDHFANLQVCMFSFFQFLALGIDAWLSTFVNIIRTYLCG